jgi:hypothetical protein
MTREFNFICIDCGQPAIAKGALAKRCEQCRRIRHNQRSAARMAKKREDPQFRDADRARARTYMKHRRILANIRANSKRGAAEKRRQLVVKRTSQIESTSP